MAEVMTVANAPGALPLIGHLGRFLRPRPFLLPLPQHGDLVRIRLGTRPAYVVCSSKLVQQVFADDRTFDRGGPVFDEARNLLGDGLATCPHTRHRRTRRLVQQVFRANRYPRYAGLMADQVRGTVEHWRDGQVLNVLEEMFTLVAKVSTVTLFSSRLTPVQLDGMYDDVRAITTGWMRRMLTPAILHRVAGGRSFDRSLRHFHDAIAETITHYRRDPTAAPDDVPAILLAAVDDDGSALSDRQVHDEVMTFFFGSIETTAATLAWTLHMLTEHRHVQQRVRDEAQTILRDGPLDWEAVRRLEYTRRVVRETLRLYPPTWLLTRITRHDTTLGGHSIPAGTNVFISPLIQGRDSTAFPDPNRFDPDRRESSDPSTRDTYIAFGLRARRCIGEIFGMTEVIIAIAAITSCWHLHAIPDGTDTTPQVSLVLRPRMLRLRLAAATNQPPLLTKWPDGSSVPGRTETMRSVPHVLPAARIDLVEERFVRQWHPYRWGLRNTTWQWVIEQRLLPGDVESAYADDLLRYTDLIAGYYVGDSAPVVQVIADFSTWFFIWDDWHAVAARRRRDRAWHQLSAALRAALHDPRNHRSHPSPLVAALADVFVRLFTPLGPTWNVRLASHMERVLDAYDQEYHNLVTGTVPAVAEFLELRRWTFGQDVWIDLLELTAGQELPSAIHRHDVYQRAAYASQRFSSGYNDLCSLSKEIAAGEVHNLGVSLMRHEGLDFDQAQAGVRSYASYNVQRFLQAESEIHALLNTGVWPPGARRTVKSCIFNMRNWISSVYWFHNESVRYRIQDWAAPAWPPYVSRGDVP